MTAKEFAQRIKNLIPDPNAFVGHPEGFGEIIISSLTVTPREVHQKFADSDCVLDLVYNFDTSSLSLDPYKFNSPENIVEDEHCIFIGWREAFSLVIRKDTNEILEVEWGTPSHIVSKQAKTQSPSLDALAEYAKIFIECIVGKISDSERHNKLLQVQLSAGGTDYFPIDELMIYNRLWKRHCAT